MPRVEVSAPARSKRPWLRGGLGQHGAADGRAATMPIGTLTNSTQRQDAHCGEHAAGDQADGAAADGDRGVEADRAGALAPCREHRHQQREGRRRGQRAADALQRRGRRAARPGSGRSRRPARRAVNRRDAGEEDAAAAEDVAGAGAEQQQAAEGQGVGVDHPRQVGGGEVQRGLDVGQGDVHDRRVEHDHQLAGQDQGEDEAGWRGRAAVAAGRRRTPVSRRCGVGR